MGLKVKTDGRFIIAIHKLEDVSRDWIANHERNASINLASDPTDDSKSLNV